MKIGWQSIQKAVLCSDRTEWATQSTRASLPVEQCDYSILVQT